MPPQCARRYFDAHPEAACFSIGMNDTAAGGFCQCAACRALDPADPVEQKTPRGMPNYSNRFFTFANRVAVELARTHPDKYLGCLAYNVTEPPPSFEVHPRIIPYLTAGRANWTDPAIREGDQKLIRGWCRKVPIVGIYDYYYGSGFISPRIFTHLTEASLKFAHQAGVRAFYAEIYSTWSLDGPKAYVASQLLWDVSQNAETLVDDFCRGLFGKAAAPMRAYFRFLEQRWMSRPSGSTTMWQGMFDPAQLEIWTPAACAEARGLLAEAEAAAAQRGGNGPAAGKAVQRRIPPDRALVGALSRREIAAQPGRTGALRQRPNRVGSPQSRGNPAQSTTPGGDCVRATGRQPAGRGVGRRPAAPVRAASRAGHACSAWRRPRHRRK